MSALLQGPVNGRNPLAARQVCCAPSLLRTKPAAHQVCCAPGLTRTKSCRQSTRGRQGLCYGALERDDFIFESSSRFITLFEHVLFRKTGSRFCGTCSSVEE